MECFILFRGRLVEKASTINSEIHEFLKEHKIKNPLPRAGNNLILPPLKEMSSNDYTEEEEDELAIYLVQHFAKLRSLEEHDPATFIKHTV